MVETKWPPIWPPFCFYHLKAGHKSGFQMVGPSLDRFINKDHKKYFIHAKTV
jgi:hypothetical protein